jgi:hypothetical protein
MPVVLKVTAHTASPKITVKNVGGNEMRPNGEETNCSAVTGDFYEGAEFKRAGYRYEVSEPDFATVLVKNRRLR